MALFELFNTHAKVRSIRLTITPPPAHAYAVFWSPRCQLSMLSEVRSLVAPHDLEIYDRLVQHREKEARQAWQGGLGVLHPSGQGSPAGSVIAPVWPQFLTFTAPGCSGFMTVHEGSWSAIIFSFVCAIKSFCQMKQRKSTLYSKQVTEWNVTVKSGRWRKLSILVSDCDAVVFMAGQPCFDWCPTLSSILPQRPHSARV